MKQTIYYCDVCNHSYPESDIVKIITSPLGFSSSNLKNTTVEELKEYHSLHIRSEVCKDCFKKMFKDYPQFEGDQD